MKKKSRTGSKKRGSASLNSFTDPVTGQRIASDTVYGPESGLFRFAGLPDPSSADYQFEFELGAKQVAWTFSVTPKSGSTSAIPSVNRFVFNGDFAYSRTGGVSGRVDSVGSGNFFPNSYQREVYEFVNVIAPPPAMKDFQILSDFLALAFSSASLGQKLFSYEGNPDPNTIPSESAGPLAPDKNGLAAFGLTDFFIGDWWSNPFAPNLV